jgi:hypothetical protein
MRRRSFLRAIIGAPLAALVPWRAMLPSPVSMIDELNAVTLQEVYPAMVRDEWFMSDPLLGYIECLNDGVIADQYMGQRRAAL